MYVIVKMTSCNNEQLYYVSNMYLEFIKVFVKMRNMFIDYYVFNYYCKVYFVQRE